MKHERRSQLLQIGRESKTIRIATALGAAAALTLLVGCAANGAYRDNTYSGAGYSDARPGAGYSDARPSDYDQQRQQYDQQSQQYEQQRQQYDQAQNHYNGAQMQFDRRENYDHAYSTDQDPYYRDCQQQRASNQTGGLVIGAIAGGLLGSTIARGPSRGAGTVLGAIAGGAVGASVGGNLNCEDRGYANRAYYSGLESGRNNADYRWRNDGTGNYGDFRVGDYYQDRDGYRCARYTQTIWVDGRATPSSGNACRQRDGNWAIVN